jgi:hypothetical protein
MVARLRIAIVSALVSLALAAPGALAYDGEVGQQVDVAGASQVLCPTPVSATVTVVDLDGNPLEGVEVTWSTGDVGTTDAAGQDTITVQVTADIVVTATTVGAAVGSLAITCVQEGITLPRTDTALPADSGAAIPWWAYVLLFVTGPGLLVFAARRR